MISGYPTKQNWEDNTLPELSHTEKNIYKLGVSEALVELSLYFGNERKPNRRLALFNRYDFEMDSISSVGPLVNIFGKVEILIRVCSSLPQVN